MSSVVNFVTNTVSDLKGKVEEAMIDLIGTQTHNFIDPLVSNCVVRNPSIPLCCSMPTGHLELGTLISINATATSPMFAKRFLDNFVECLGNACPTTQTTATTRVPTSTTNLKRKAQRKSSSVIRKFILQRPMFRVDLLTGNCGHGNRAVQESFSHSSSSSSLSIAPMETNIALHFNPRFAGSGEPDNHVVMNSRFGSEWGDEQRERGDFPFELGKPFKLIILVEEDGFKIAVNGSHKWIFKHRCNFREIVRMHISGHLAIELIEFRKELKYVERSSISSSSSFSSLSGDENPAKKVEVKMVQTPSIPYSEYDSRLGNLYNIYISGRLPNVCLRAFVVNLASAGNLGVIKVIPFHMSIRADEKVIVRNSRQNETWGDEERSMMTPFPFQTGAPFDMLISKSQTKILVAINGQFAFEFSHRLDHKTIDTLEITGSVEVASIRYEYL